MKVKNGSKILFLILIFAFLTRIFRLQVPDRYMFDEVYHVVTAKLIGANDPRAFEWWHAPIEPNTAIDWLHPPLAKYTQGFSIRVLGSSSFSWRISSVLFGVGVIWAVYQLAQKLFDDQRISLLAAFLAALDGLLLVQSRITMNDIHVTFFILLTLISYLNYKKNPQNIKLFMTGLSAGLAMGSKWSGLFILVIIWFLEGLEWLKKIITQQTNWDKLVSHGLLMIVSLGLIPFTIYMLSYGQMFLQGKGWQHFIDLHQQIWWYQTNLTATHSYQSQPWQWFLNLRPVWFHVDYPDPTHIANIYAFGNPLLHPIGALSSVLTFLFIIITKIKTRLSQNLSIEIKNLQLLFITYLLLWLPWQISPRIMFYYHYTPAVPLLTIILAYWLVRTWEIKTSSDWNKIFVGSIVILIVIAFFIWYPQWTAIPMPKDFVNKIYYFIPSWK